MNRYIKLLNWEINRFGKYYAALLIVTLLSQFTGVLLFAKDNLNRIHDGMQRESVTAAEYAARSGKIHFEHFSSSSTWFMGPIALCAAALVLLVFLIWYREWFGKNTFAYRLLMLPTSRMNVYLAKAGAILLFVLGLIALQLLVLPLQIGLFNSLVPAELRESVSVVGIVGPQAYLRLLIPRHFIEFILSYGAGISLVLVIFTAILLERSYRLKGLIAGVVYAGAAVFLFVSPQILSSSWVPSYFYPGEVLLMAIASTLIIAAASLWLSAFLLRKKVTV